MAFLLENILQQAAALPEYLSTLANPRPSYNATPRRTTSRRPAPRRQTRNPLGVREALAQNIDVTNQAQRSQRRNDLATAGSNSLKSALNNFIKLTQLSQQLGERTGRAIFQPAINYGKYVGEAGLQGARYLTDPVFRKAIEAPESLTPAEIQEVNKRQTFLVDPKRLANRGQIAQTGIKRTAGAASYPIMAMTAGAPSLLRAALIGAGGGAAGGFARDEDNLINLRDILAGAAIGGVSGAGAYGLRKLLQASNLGHTARKQNLNQSQEAIRQNRYGMQNPGSPVRQYSGTDQYFRQGFPGQESGSNYVVPNSSFSTSYVNSPNTVDNVINSSGQVVTSPNTQSFLTGNIPQVKEAFARNGAEATIKAMKQVGNIGGRPWHQIAWEAAQNNPGLKVKILNAMPHDGYWAAFVRRWGGDLGLSKKLFDEANQIMRSADQMVANANWGD